MRLDEIIKLVVSDMRSAVARAVTNPLQGPRGPWAIARASDSSVQIRFVFDASAVNEIAGIRLDSRVRLGEHAATQARKISDAHDGWARWHRVLGFSIAYVLADDWQQITITEAT